MTRSTGVKPFPTCASNYRVSCVGWLVLRSEALLRRVARALRHRPSRPFSRNPGSLETTKAEGRKQKAEVFHPFLVPVAWRAACRWFPAQFLDVFADLQKRPGMATGC